MNMLRRMLLGSLVAANLMILGAILMPRPAMAASAAVCTGSSSSIPILPKWYEYLPKHYDGAADACVIDAQFPDAIPEILLAVFDILLRIAGLIAVVFVVYGGFQYLTSTGEPDKARNARTTIINALVGLILAMFATLIVSVIGRNIG